jgi:hypothetical protein
MSSFRTLWRTSSFILILKAKTIKSSSPKVPSPNKKKNLLQLLMLKLKSNLRSSQKQKRSRKIPKALNPINS